MKTQLLGARPGVRILRHAHLGEDRMLILKGALGRGRAVRPGRRRGLRPFDQAFPLTDAEAASVSP
jgi:hypothetical protein